MVVTKVVIQMFVQITHFINQNFELRVIKVFS